VEEPYVLIHFAKDVFSIDAIKRAAYRLSDRIVVDVEPDATGITCKLRANAGARDFDMADAERDFRTEVLDQDLRMQIAKETEPLRNLILSLAFSKTGLHG
jgi:His-Xaa-Ser system protein HxsD